MRASADARARSNVVGIVGWCVRDRALRHALSARSRSPSAFVRASRARNARALPRRTALAGATSTIGREQIDRARGVATARSSSLREADARAHRRQSARLRRCPARRAIEQRLPRGGARRVIVQVVALRPRRCAAGTADSTGSARRVRAAVRARAPADARTRDTASAAGSRLRREAARR